MFHPLHLSFYFASFKNFVKEDGRMEMRIDKQGERHKLERRKKRKWEKKSSFCIVNWKVYSAKHNHLEIMKR